jgi:hypothetical protein
MKNALLTLANQKRKIDTRVTNENKNSIINQMNKNATAYGMPKISKNASVKDVSRYKSEYLERLTYDIVTLAVNEGKDIIAEIQARDLKKSNDYETKRLGEFAKDLAKAKKESSKNLTKEEKQFLERGNNNIKGFGNEDMITLFEKAKNNKLVQALINEVKSQDPKQIYYEKQLGVFENVFQKVGIKREDDITRLKDKINSMSLEDAQNITNQLLVSVELYDSDKQGVSRKNETELANARLDDMLIKLDLKKTGLKKVQKTLDKYKSKLNTTSGFIYED